MSGFYKGISGLSLFVSIPLLIKYLSQEEYGIWVLVFTLFQWVLVMDFGIQSSLKTKVPVLFHENKIDLVKSYIKITYKYAIFLAFGIFVCFLVFTSSLDIKTLLNIKSHSSLFISLLFLLNILFFCLNSVAGIHKSLYVAFLKGKFAEQSLAVNQLGTLILLFVAFKILPNLDPQNKLLLITLINGLFCFLVNVIYTFRFFKIEQLDLKTKIKPPKKFVKEIITIGLKFMAIQLGMMLFFTIDNYIISSNFSPKDVVPYDTVTKIFQFPIMIILAGLSPMWSLFAKYFAEKNSLNLLKSFKKFNLIFILICFFIFILYLLSPFLITIWIKDKLEIPRYLILYVAVLTAFRIFTSFYGYFLNGIGQLNKFIAIVLISLLLKLPLTNFLIHLHFGINSVILSTLIIMLSWVVFFPLESYKIINKLNK